VPGPRVTFSPGGRTVTAEPGQSLLDAAFAASIPLASVCGGRGICGRCRVVVHGAVETDRAADPQLGRDEVLACLTHVVGDVTVEVPAVSRLEGAQILTGLERGAAVLAAPDEAPVALAPAAGHFAPDPLAFALPLALPPPTLDDHASDIDRLAREARRQGKVRHLAIPIELARRVPGVVRAADWRVTSIIAHSDGGYELVDLRQGIDRTRVLGIAVDIGTTTVVTHLVDLATGTTLGVAAQVNRQVAFGDDVISRIIHAGEPGGLDRLRSAVLDEVNELVGSLAAAHAAVREEIVAAVLAGNTTMVHLFLGLPPAEIRREPYVPAATSPPACHAAELGLRIHPRAPVMSVPGVASYVGGDITADVLAAGMDASSELSMLIDAGTNGETVIGDRDFLACCACSAGPAFEGGGISSGMRAAHGAIQRVDVTADGTLSYETIGGAPPRGICGSGLVDLLAELLRAGYMDRDGSLRPDAPVVRPGPSGPEVLVATAAESATGADIVLTEADVENLVRAKAAVYAGAAVLARRLGIDMLDIRRVYVAGGFGTYLDVRRAILVGLLPDVPVERVTFIGNGSVAGAKMTLLSHDAWLRAAQVAARMTYRELSVDPAFMDEYVSAMFLPHTDCARFPSACELLGAA
jgi:uncharacterized 2Fe-2S/4Fe-4S cluster protein (DUF4445 family)